MKKLLQYRVGLRYMEESIFEYNGFNNGISVLLVFEWSFLIPGVTQGAVLSSVLIPIKEWVA
jgi:hypothetical protein